MPLMLSDKCFGQGSFALWQMAEPQSFFEEALQKAGVSANPQMWRKGQRLQHWLVSRYLLSTLSGIKSTMELESDTHGKPFLTGSSLNISLSHSGDLIAVMTGTGLVGIDVQYFRANITALEAKFAAESESTVIDRSDPIRHLHLLWSAKETLYKIYSRKQLSFKKHLRVELPPRISPTGELSGLIFCPEGIIYCDLNYCFLENAVLVYGTQKSIMPNATA